MKNSNTNTLSLEELLQKDYIYLATDRYFENGLSEVDKIDTSEVQKTKLSETYSFDGNKYGSYSAGDYIEVTAFNVAQINDIIDKHNEENDEDLGDWDQGQIISACFDSDTFELLVESGIEFDGVEVTAYNFWNGHNWQSYILECELIDEAINVTVIDKLDAILKLDSIRDFDNIEIDLDLNTVYRSNKNPQDYEIDEIEFYYE